MTTHAKYSASGAHRWMKCSGSIQLSETVPPPESSSYADEGTKAHAALDFIIKGYLKNKQPGIAAALLAGEYPKKMIDHGVDSFKRASQFITETATLLSDIKVHVPDVGFGTLDIGVVEEFGTLTVIDYKYGRGIAVDVKGNYQLLYYAIGLAIEHYYNFESVQLIIDQPRAFHPNGLYRIWKTDMDRLKLAHAELVEGVNRCEDSNPIFVSGSHCKFCPAILVCDEYKNKGLREAQDAFNGFDYKN